MSLKWKFTKDQEFFVCQSKPSFIFQYVYVYICTFDILFRTRTQTLDTRLMILLVTLLFYGLFILFKTQYSARYMWQLLLRLDKLLQRSDEAVKILL